MRCARSNKGNPNPLCDGELDTAGQRDCMDELSLVLDRKKSHYGKYIHCEAYYLHCQAYLSSSTDYPETMAALRSDSPSNGSGHELLSTRRQVLKGVDLSFWMECNPNRNGQVSTVWQGVFY